MAEAIAVLHATASPSAWRDQLRDLLERFVDVCQTLAYAHSRRVIHRDLKAANIMLGDFGETIVLDWGIAKSLNSDSTDLNLASPKNHVDQQACVSRAISPLASQGSQELTQQGSLVGTPSAMSPEQAAGEIDSLDQRSGLFSLGTLLYELLTGRSPFRTSSVEQTLEAVKKAEYIPCRQVNRRVPRPLASICERALQRERCDRYANAEELAQEVRSYLAGQRVSAHQEAWWEAADRWMKNNRKTTVTIVMAIGLIALISSAALALVNQARHREASAHRETLEQLVASRQATDTWLIGLSGDLQHYPELAPVRSDLLAQADAHYQHLDSRPTFSTEQQLEAARVRIRLGDLRYLEQRDDEARSAFQQAL